MSFQPKPFQFNMKSAKGRLAYYLAYAEWCTDSPVLGPKGWREVRTYLECPYAERCMKQSIGRGEGNNAGERYVENLYQLGWRDCGPAHKLVKIDHTGWYTDNFQGQLLVGHVLQLPARNGVCQYVPATAHSEWDAATVYLGDICDSERDAAYRADRLAEIEAELARDDDAKFRAESQIEDAQETIKNVRKQCLTLLREIRRFRVIGDGTRENLDPEKWTTPETCKALKAAVQSHLQTIREARERIAELKRDYWASVEPG